MKAPVDFVYIKLYYVLSEGQKGYYILISLNEPMTSYKIQITRAKALQLNIECRLKIQTINEPLQAQELRPYTELSGDKRRPGINNKYTRDYTEGYLGLYYSSKDQSHFVHLLISKPETKLYFNIQEKDVKDVARCCFIDIHCEKEQTLRLLAS
jgi:hypothetical protein